MKTALTILICISLMILASAALSSVVPNYMVMTQQAEKWYKSEGTWTEESGYVPTMRIYSRVNGVFNGSIILEKETRLKNDIIERNRFLFSKDIDGNIYFSGDLDNLVLKEPILWIDAPLLKGKTWYDTRPEFRDGIPTGNIIHYVFAVMGWKDITCPAGTFRAHSVFLWMVYPDNSVEIETYWYNEHCGLIMCTMNNQRCFDLQKAIIPGVGEFPNVKPHDPIAGEGQGVFSGLKASPNPLNPMTTISFELRDKSRVALKVYDVSGKLIRTLIAGEILDSGPCSVSWNGKDDRGSPVASGTYIYRLQAGGSERSDSMTLVR
jgi:hypothetical protein